jgi:hypothetical protein
MKILIITIALIFTLSVSAAQLYKIIHSDGSVTYTDTPQTGAVEVKMTGTNSAVIPRLKSANANQQPAKRLDKSFPAYNLELISPQHEATVRNNLGKVSVTARLSPIGNGKFELYLDGELVQTSTAPSFHLQNVERGEHSIQVKFIHHTGKILASSNQSVFFMHQASVLINPN